MSILRMLALVVVFVWALGFLVGNAGSIIHALIVLALALFIIDLLSGRRAV